MQGILESIKKYNATTLAAIPATLTKFLQFEKNMLEDYFLPVRGGQSGTEIDTLAGMEFTGIDDIEYLRESKVFNENPGLYEMDPEELALVLEKDDETTNESGDVEGVN